MNCKNRQKLREQKWSFSVKIRKTQDCKVKNYQKMFDFWRKQFGVKITHHVFEKDKSGRLHIHGICVMHVGQKYTDLVDTKLHSYKFCKIFTEVQEEGWLSYMEKQEYQEPEPDESCCCIPRKPLFKSVQLSKAESEDFRANFSDTEWKEYLAWQAEHDYDPDEI